MTVSSANGPRLTPDQIQAISFRLARLGRRGLDEDQVNEFCDQVEYELVRLLDEKVALQEEVARLRKRVLSGSAEAAQGGDARLEDAHLQAVNMLAKAQRTADRYVADARTYSRELAEDARRRRDEIIAETRSRADLVLKEAHADASRAAAAVPPPAEPLDAAQCQELQAELVYQRTFSDVYRTHLRAYLEVLVRNLDEWERAEKGSLAPARAERPGSPGPAMAGPPGPYGPPDPYEPPDPHGPPDPYGLPDPYEPPDPHGPRDPYELPDRHPGGGRVSGTDLRLGNRL
jgi:DivIVA domain-containing protein